MSLALRTAHRKQRVSLIDLPSKSFRPLNFLTKASLTSQTPQLRTWQGPTSEWCVRLDSHSISARLRRKGRKKNALLPGLIETGMTTYTFERAKERGTLGKVGQLNPMRRSV